MKCKIFFNWAKAGKSSCEFFFSECVPLKKYHFIYALLGQSQVIQKVGLIGQPQWELDSVLFLYLESRALTDPTEIELP
jgi:hypothetical protein